MMFEFLTSTRIIFGSGTSRSCGKLAAQFGRRALVVKAAGLPDEAISQSLAKEEISTCLFYVVHEPSIELIDHGVHQAREYQAEMVIAIGGGSAIDAAKSIAAMMTNTGDLTDYLEVVGKNKPIINRPAPVIALPTTSGTGAEVTRNAVISIPEKRFKASLRSPLLAPQIAIIDPELTYSLPTETTAHTGMDALTQVMEPFVSRKHNMMTDLFCKEGLKCGSEALLNACQNPSDPSAREKMSWCSLLGGLALSNAGLGAVHGFASPMGGMFDIPHGLICAALLASVMKTNIATLQKREPDNPASQRYQIIARILTNNMQATCIDGVRWVENLASALRIPGLGQMGISRQSFQIIAEKAQTASSMKANPIELTKGELVEILEMAY
jgi:alcohol dehydrogenase class IV